MFLKHFAMFTGNTCVGLSFSIKLQAGGITGMLKFNSNVLQNLLFLTFSNLLQVVLENFSHLLIVSNSFQGQTNLLKTKAKFEDNPLPENL